MFYVGDFEITWRVIAIAVVVLALLVFHIIPYWRVVRRAGFSGAWSLFHFVPLVGLVLLWVFAFIPWPAVEDKTR
jgi:hypothetical protein